MNELREFGTGDLRGCRRETFCEWVVSLRVVDGGTDEGLT